MAGLMLLILARLALWLLRRLVALVTPGPCRSIDLNVMIITHIQTHIEKQSTALEGTPIYRHHVILSIYLQCGTLGYDNSTLKGGNHEPQTTQHFLDHKMYFFPGKYWMNISCIFWLEGDST
jgi:hypothetical protein